MCDLFTALFGGLFYTNKSGSDKRKLEQAEKRKVDWETWEASVTDANLERELTLYIKNPLNKQAVLAELQEVYSTLPSCANSDKNEALHDMRRFNDYPYFLSLRILMARCGKILQSDINLGIDPPGAYDDNLKSFRTRFEELMIWMDQELRNHGITIPLLFDVHRVPGHESWEHINIPLAEVATSPYRFHGLACYIWHHNMWK